LIEDACHALGAKYKFKNKYLPIGSCKHSDISVFSLHAVKTITSGEGGIVNTNNKVLYNKMLNLRSHGIKRDKSSHWKYNVICSGFNYRLSDINCALALSQLKKISKFINYRRKVFLFYRKKIDLIKKKYLITLPNYKNNKSSFHLFLMSIDFKKNRLNKDHLMQYLKKEKILCQYHYIPIYKFKIYDKKMNIQSYPGSEYYYNNTISVPMYYNLTKNQQNKILIKLVFFLKNYKT
jgi:dTDP-4-amino-4,6-dideoxygalactose transaminase